ncbi:hypothetical protein KFK09_017571 [Dendrobium nobile]|uniref:Uncharacterized protein n=1 Tax=Dendrobium nobile TaxID=94219 RepID=A0A8T3B1B9_DENNO|nr:hypothetical protein KFK09_017571 [Dendrobium nobile]
MTRQFRSFLKRNQKRRRKPGHIKSECPKLKATPRKEKVEEKPMVKKGKKKFQRTFWVDLASDSSETKKEEEVTNICLMADILDQSDKEEDRAHTRPHESTWYLDNDCSKHMIGDIAQFISMETRSGCRVTLRDNTTRKVVGSDKPRREKNITLKVEELKSDLSQPEDEDDIALMTRQFRSFLKKKQKRLR